MASVELTFLGSGDAFGSGGRLQTCMLVEGGGACFLIDCGTTALIAMRRHGIDPNCADMLDRLATLDREAAEDGKVVRL